MENIIASAQELVASVSPEAAVGSQHSSASNVVGFMPVGTESTIPLNSSIVDANQSDGIEFQASELWLRHSMDVVAVYCLAYSVVFVLGIGGNSFVVAVVLRSPRMRTVTNYFIVNLALADILVLLFCLPATLISNILVPWILGSFMCKTVSYLQGVSVSASINTLVAISLDRFLAICYPLQCQMSTRNARRIIMLIWIFSLVITLPWAIYFQLVPIDASQPDFCICTEMWPQKGLETLYFLGANMGLCYLLPLVVITACYTAIWIKVWRRNIPGETNGTNADAVIQRSKLKVVKMLLIVVVLFVLSWLPLYIIFTRVKVGGPVEGNSFEEKVLVVMVPVAQWLGASNSCINPVLYAFFNKKFRRGFLAIIKSRKCCGTLRYDAAYRRTSTMMRSTLRSRCDTQCDYVSTTQV